MPISAALLGVLPSPTPPTFSRRSRVDRGEPHRIPNALTLSALLVAGCGAPAALVLPEEPVARAATCGVVATASARGATADIKAPLPIAAEGHILHYALLSATADKSFSAETAGAVVQRMRSLEPEVTAGKWQDLMPACRAAFPDAERSAVALPADPLDAELGCSGLAQFTATALEPAKAQYGAQLGAYRHLRARLSDKIGPALRARAGSAPQAQRRVEGEAMAKIVRAGPPVAVLAACATRFDG